MEDEDFLGRVSFFGPNYMRTLEVDEKKEEANERLFLGVTLKPASVPAPLKPMTPPATKKRKRVEKEPKKKPRKPRKPKKPRVVVRNHKCVYEGCDRKFDSMGHLRQHEEAVHLGYKRHRCQRCRIGYSAKAALKRHSLKCTGAIKRPGYVEYYCRTCPYATKYVNKMNRHSTLMHDCDDLGAEVVYGPPRAIFRTNAPTGL